MYIVKSREKTDLIEFCVSMGECSEESNFIEIPKHFPNWILTLLRLRYCKFVHMTHILLPRSC